ncbi:MoxR-like ATPase [Streptomyces sp. cf386]|uniref:AAA family ATPase n=1 Tax=Streptomyces sp. cf386 TaxID=1761904 RepID=UPI000889B0B5|nr:MoxR family ATPase [Streptomyces sp. cf386]SDM35494.1 MoxR-like ATPase [Streptomyces sp. cf386]
MSQEQTGGGQRGDGTAGPEWLDTPDRGDGRVYVMPYELEFAVKVALATGRPLLLRGMPGSGKSSLAPFIARQLGWRYYEHVVSYRTQPRELLWNFDSVRRLGDAQVAARRGERPDDASYVQPGVLWWALAPRSARRRGRPEDAVIPDPCLDPFEKINRDRSPDHAVVLIDEIDKADPDVPNSLLVPLGLRRFLVAEIGEEIRPELPGSAPQSTGENASQARHLVVLTTNEERELPQALLRRCVVHVLPEHDRDMLVRIAKEHMQTWPGEVTPDDEELAESVADKLTEVRDEAAMQDVRRPSTAEYLDALLACRSLGIRPDGEEWQLLTRNVLIKPQQMAGDPA